MAWNTSIISVFLFTFYNNNNNYDLLRVNHVQDTSQLCKVSGINPILGG